MPFIVCLTHHNLIFNSSFFILTGNVQSGAKLEILIVCRFAKLSVDEQRIARTASIIGTSFASDVLNNILPKQLRAYLPTILDSLVRSHWLNISSEQRAEGIRVQYSFSHPLLHRTLYDLTPSSVKCKVHLLIAKVILMSNCVIPHNIISRYSVTFHFRITQYDITLTLKPIILLLLFLHLDAPLLQLFQLYELVRYPFYIFNSFQFLLTIIFRLSWIAVHREHPCGGKAVLHESRIPYVTTLPLLYCHDACCNCLPITVSLLFTSHPSAPFLDLPLHFPRGPQILTSPTLQSSIHLPPLSSIITPLHYSPPFSFTLLSSSPSNFFSTLLLHTQQTTADQVTIRVRHTSIWHVLHLRW